MFPFLSSESREKLPAGSRGGIFHENDPGHQTIFSRIFSIFNNVTNLELTPEVQAVMASRRKSESIDNLQFDNGLAIPDLAASDISVENTPPQTMPTETVTSPQIPQSLEEIREKIALHALPIGSRGGVSPDVAQSIEGANDERLSLGA